MATDLTGLKVKDTYNSLLKIGDNSSLSATPDKISDGFGNESVLYLSTSQVSIGALPATGYDLTVGNSGIKTQIIDIVGAATAASLQLTGGSGSQGTLSWNTDEETVDIIQNGAVLQLGQETHVHVKNQTGSTITDGTPVYVTGTLGSSGRLTVAPMIADGSIEAKYFLGITTEDIPNGEDGKVTTFGKIRGLDTTAYSEGQTLYVSASTAGEFQTTAPVAPALDLEVAIVINVSANNGTIFVRATNGQYLGLLHDVYLNGVSDKDLLVYDNTNSRWSNSKTIGDLSAGNLTLSGYLRGAANFVIDPAAYDDETGVVQILGDLRVDGTTTTINSTTVTIDDKNLVLASGSATAADANGAGITIDGADATMTYNSTSDRFVFNKDIETDLVGNVTGDLQGNADTASTLETARNIAVDGAVTGNADFDGSGDITITTSVNHNHDADYVNVTGDTMTGNLDFNDDVQARFGTGDDLTLYHNATNSFIDNATGSILIRNQADDQDIVLVSDDGAGSITDYLRADGSEGSVKLFHYGSQKLETTATGVSVTGAFSGNLDTSSISGSTIDINASTRLNLQYNGTTQAFVDSTGFNVAGGLNLTGVDGISLTDEDSTTDSYFHANVDYDAGLYTVTSNARYGADYIQVDGLDSREETRFVISPKDIGDPDPHAYLYIGGDNSITAPNTLVDWHTIEMNALLVKLNANLNIQSGSLLVGGVTVINSSRDITANSFTGDGSAVTNVDAVTLDDRTLDGAFGIGQSLFNNQGRDHDTYTDFNDTGLRSGVNYIQGGTNSPTGTTSDQWYGFRLGLGADYGTATGSSGDYASELYWNRQAQGSDPYLWARDMESGTWGSWRKMSAGNADNADTLNGVAGSSFLRSDADDTATGKITINNNSNSINDPTLTITSSQGGGSFGRLMFSGTSTVAGVINRGTASADLYFDESSDTGKYYFRSSGRGYFYGDLSVGTTDADGKLVVRGDANSGTISLFKNLDAGTSSYAEVIVRSVDSDNDLRIGSSKSYVDSEWQGGWVFAPRKLLLKSNNDVNIFAGGSANSNIVATFAGSSISLNQSTEVTGKVTITGSPAIDFTGSGTGTYNKTVIYNDQTYGFLVEATKATDSALADKKPITLTWRGGYNSNGGLNLNGDTKLYTNDTGLGINKTSASYTLDVAGTVRLGGGESSNRVILMGDGSNAVYMGATNINTINVGYDEDNDNYNLHINYRGYQSGNTRFRNLVINDGKTGDIAKFVGSTGRFGVGTMTPDAKIHVEGSSIIANNTSIDPDSYANKVIAGGIADGSGWALASAVGGNVGAGSSWAVGVATNNKFYMGLGDSANANSMQTFLTVDGNRHLFLVPSSGNVGIGLDGTSSPSAKLEVKSSGSTLTNNIKFGDGTVGYLASGSSGVYLSDNSGNARLMFKHSGEVGIGTSSPDYKLEVNGTAYIGDTFYTNSTSYLGGLVRLNGTTSSNSQLDLPIQYGALRWYNGSTFRGGIGTQPWSGIGGSIDLGFYLNTGTNFHIGALSSPFVTFDSANQRVGIGTDTPSNPLHVYNAGNTRIRIDSGSNNAGIMLSESGSNKWSIASVSGGNLQFFSEAGLGNLMYLSSTGNLGIGTTSAQTYLDITGNNLGSKSINSRAGNSNDGNSSAHLIMSWNGNPYNSSGYAHSIRTKHDSGSTSLNTIEFWLWKYGTDSSNTLGSLEAMRIQGDGKLQVANDIIAFSTTVSDARLKDEVVTIDNALDKVKALRGVEYVWNKGGREGQKDLGFIAQEVEQVIPEIVRENEMPLMDDSGETYKTVDYEKVVAVLVEAVKEQQKQIDELKARLDA